MTPWRAHLTLARAERPLTVTQLAPRELSVHSSAARMTDSLAHRVSLIPPLLVLALAACGGGDVNGTAITPPTVSVPEAPTAVVATPGNASIRVTFSAPTSDGGSPVLTYVASCSAAGASTLTATGASSPLSVTGLTNGTSYTCSVAATNSKGTGAAAVAIAVTPTAPTPGAFRGSVVLGSPTATSIKANVYAADQAGTVSIAYGTTPGIYDTQTATVPLIARTPVEISLDGLRADTRYFYRLNYQTSGAGSGPTAEASFQTARPPGRSFVFGVQGDSHPERLRSQFDSLLYVNTLTTAAADNLDFYIMLGDDFSVDQISAPVITNDLVTERYRIQRPYLGIIGKSSPVFLVNGNHEQAARYLLDGTPNNIAVWAQNARNAHYSQPAPDGFYSGNSEQVPFIGLLRNYYAWQWGDALFVTIDPYWSSPVAVDNVFGGDTKRASLWDITHGDAQYQWLKNTLERSTAKYKFVFAHHVMGTQRGGIELARQYEWGGEDARGVNQFAANRPTWQQPIHQLFVSTKVTAFFQGHDHIWVRQQLDGVTYQSVSEPADPNYSLFNADAYLTGDKFPNSGYTRVTVSPANVKVEYVRTYLSADVGPGKTNGSVAFSYTIP